MPPLELPKPPSLTTADPTLYRDAMMAHSSLATVFPMPVVLTLSLIHI